MTIGDNLIDVIRNPEFCDRGLLRGLDPHHLYKLVGLALEARFERGHVIFHQGDLTAFFYLIVSGSVELESTSAAGEKHVQTLRAGDVFGWSSVLDGERKHSQARAMSEVVALAFDGQELVPIAVGPVSRKRGPEGEATLRVRKYSGPTGGLADIVHLSAVGQG